ncbi:MAG: VOC family protein [Armatimonadota bacterium]
MSIRYESAVVFARDLGRLRAFYQDVLEQRVAKEREADIVFDGGLRLVQQENSNGSKIPEPKSMQQLCPPVAVYFESDDLDALLSRLMEIGALFAQPMTQYSSGQRYMRFYDPEGHLIEVSEPMWKVVRRYQDMGLEYEEIAERTALPVGMVVEILNTSLL